MTVHVAAVDRAALLDLLFNQLDGGTVEVRTGGQEANPEADGAGVLLASLTFAAPAFVAATGAAGAAVTKAANAINPDANANASGNAGHFRLLTPGSSCVLTGDVAPAGSDLNMPVAIVAGATVSITSMTAAMGA